MTNPACDMDRIPVVDADGVVGPYTDDDCGRGAIQAERRAADAGTPLPRRLLLSHFVHTRKDVMCNAKFEACFNGVGSLIFGLPATAFFTYLTGQKTVGMIALLVIMLGAAVWTYCNKVSAPGELWERTQWLDFERRTWGARRCYTDDSFPLHTNSVPFAAMVVICCSEQYEQGISYDAGLYKLADIETGGVTSTDKLITIHSADDEKDNHAFACAIATRWGIACWHEPGGIWLKRKRLC